MRIKLIIEPGSNWIKRAIINDTREIEIMNALELNDQIRAQVDKQVRHLATAEHTEMVATNTIQDIVELLAKREFLPGPPTASLKPEPKPLSSVTHPAWTPAGD